MADIRAPLAILLIGFALAFQAAADDAHHEAGAKPATTGAPAAGFAAGEVRRVDMEAGKITIRHGPLANLDMPAMTMVFRVKDPAMIERVKPGDKINFVAEKIGGALTVLQLELVR